MMHTQGLLPLLTLEPALLSPVLLPLTIYPSTGEILSDSHISNLGKADGQFEFLLSTFLLNSRPSLARDWL